jgi:hypothetical protein
MKSNGIRWIRRNSPKFAEIRRMLVDGGFPKIQNLQTPNIRRKFAESSPNIRRIFDEFLLIFMNPGKPPSDPQCSPNIRRTFAEYSPKFAESGDSQFSRKMMHRRAVYVYFLVDFTFYGLLPYFVSYDIMYSYFPIQIIHSTRHYIPDYIIFAFTHTARLLLYL